MKITYLTVYTIIKENERLYKYLIRNKLIKKFIYNALQQLKHYEEKEWESVLQRIKIISNSSPIALIFIWRETPEGYQFWFEHHENYVDNNY